MLYSDIERSQQQPVSCMTGESGGGDHHAVGMGWVGGCAGTEQIIWLNSDQVLYSHEMAQCIPRPAAILIYAADGV